MNSNIPSGEPTLRMNDASFMADRVFDYIVDYKSKHDGLSPAYRDIISAVGISSTSTVRYYLDNLEKRGKIELTEFKSRTIKVVGGSWTYAG